MGDYTFHQIRGIILSEIFWRGSKIYNTVTVALLTILITSLASTGTEGTARTINLLWKATLGRWDKPLEK